MEHIIKFPKEKTRLVNHVNEAYEAENYQAIFSMKDEILSNLEFLKDERILDVLIEAAFNLYLFEDVIMLSDEYIKQKYESFDAFYYALLSYIAVNDIYQAKNLIRRSTLLNTESIKYYYSQEGANYSNILGLSYALFKEAAPCLLIVNYITEIAGEMAGKVEVNHQYLLFRFFDLINMIYELGYDDDIISQLEQALKIVFQLEV